MIANATNVSLQVYRHVTMYSIIYLFSNLTGMEIVCHIVNKIYRVYVIDSIRLELTLYMIHMIGMKTSFFLLKSLNLILYLIQSTLEDCNGPIVEVLCHFLFPPCGNVSVVKSPTSVCEEVCRYVFELCSEQWEEILETLKDASFVFEASILSSINCSNTGEYLEPLPHCCSYVGVEIRMSVPYLTYRSSKIQNIYI